MLLELKRFDIPPGQKIFLKEVTWDEFEQILEELGEHRGSKIAYHYHTLEIITPLLEHERNKEIIGDLIKTLLIYKKSKNQEEIKQLKSLGDGLMNKYSISRVSQGTEFSSFRSSELGVRSSEFGGRMRDIRCTY